MARTDVTAARDQGLSDGTDGGVLPGVTIAVRNLQTTQGGE